MSVVALEYINVAPDDSKHITIFPEGSSRIPDAILINSLENY